MSSDVCLSFVYSLLKLFKLGIDGRRASLAVFACCRAWSTPVSLDLGICLEEVEARNSALAECTTRRHLLTLDCFARNRSAFDETVRSRGRAAMNVDGPKISFTKSSFV